MKNNNFYYLLRFVFFIALIAFISIGCSSSDSEDTIKSDSSGNNEDDFVPGNLIVGFADYTTLDEADALIEFYGLVWVDEFSCMRDDTYCRSVVQVPEGEELEWVDLLETEPIVEYAELNHYIYPHE